MRVWVLVVLVAGCADDHAHPPDAAPPTLAYLSPVQHLTRASLALRGVRPSIAELRAVDADPAQLPVLVDRYLATPEFGATMMELHNETLLMRAEQSAYTVPALDALTGVTAMQIARGLLDEPLQLIRDVVMTDQPYTKIVTADYTMADQVTATVWGLPHTTAAETWERTTWPDGRGAAGILATNGMFLRWQSAGYNYNRGRANLIARSLLCHDFLASDIAVDTSIDLANPDAVANAVVANPSCAGCHQTLDPLGSYWFPYQPQFVPSTITTYPIPFYTPSQAEKWQTTTKRAPMFFGEPADGLAGLGAAIAADPRFARCAAIHFASYFTEVAATDLSPAWIAELQAGFTAGGYSAKQLAKAIVMSDAFRVSHETDPLKAATLVGLLKVRPEQHDRMLADLTGFQWTTNSTLTLRTNTLVGEARLLSTDFVGFRVLDGGIDSFYVLAPVFTTTVTSTLVARRAAEAAADFVIEHDATAPFAERTLLAIDLATTDPAPVRGQLVDLHARIYGELLAPDDPEIDDAYALYTNALHLADPRRAWKLVLVAMLSDARSLYY